MSYARINMAARRLPHRLSRGLVLIWEFVLLELPTVVAVLIVLAAGWLDPAVHYVTLFVVYTVGVLIGAFMAKISHRLMRWSLGWATTARRSAGRGDPLVGVSLRRALDEEAKLRKPGDQIAGQVHLIKGTDDQIRIGVLIDWTLLSPGDTARMLVDVSEKLTAIQQEHVRHTASQN